MAGPCGVLVVGDGWVPRGHAGGVLPDDLGAVGAEEVGDLVGGEGLGVWMGCEVWRWGRKGETGA